EAAAIVPQEAAVEAAPQEEAKRHDGRRRRQRTPALPVEAAVPEAPAPAAHRPRPPLTRARARIPVTGAPTEEVPPPFAHPAEYEFARILDFYGIDWEYEPRSFPLRWERGHVSEAFTPDFYLPDLNFSVELTTLKTGLTAEKNRKMRLLKELHPEVKIILLKKRDYLRLLAKYGYGPLSPDQVPDLDLGLITASRIQQRVGELGAQISRDYSGKEPILIGILRGVLCFMADLMRHISVPTSVDFMSISSYDGNGAAAVRILKDLDENIKGRDVILVEDIVDTGMTLNHVMDYLNTKRPASVRVCTLLDKRARRIADVPLDYVGFEVPDEFVVGYGLDFRQQFRSLPFIAVLKHKQLP
ncbi:MAG: hypoxanthine phosphoribosyltransferase, partial [Dehalococcoidia bacterium]|nr:hypoxanthine phosphoribosyltransferase [Dehalococcoidia bacterium]